LRSLPGRVILQSGGSKSGLGPFGYIVCESK
jgi:hypothetical protein